MTNLSELEILLGNSISAVKKIDKPEPSKKQKLKGVEITKKYIKVKKPTSLKTSPKRKIKTKPKTNQLKVKVNPVYDVGKVFDDKEFTNNYEKNFANSLEFWKELICESLAFKSSLEVLTLVMQERDEFKDLNVETIVLDRILRYYTISKISKQLNINTDKVLTSFSMTKKNDDISKLLNMFKSLKREPSKL